MSHNKLSHLWQNKRSNATQIVLNNSEFPNPPPCPSNYDQMQSYYELKCQGETRICDPLPTHDAQVHTDPACIPDTVHFWRGEVEAVLHALPRNKHSGMDGVTHDESLKVTNPGILADTSFEPTHLVQLKPKDWQPERLEQIWRTLKRMCQLKWNF